MNGATAEPCAKIMSALRANRMNMIGASQNFFLVLMNSQNSLTIDVFDICPS